MKYLTAVIAGREYPVISAKGQFKLEEVGKINIGLPRRYILNEDIYLEDIALYYGSDLLVSGVVNEADKFNIGANEEVIADLQCYDEFGRLLILPAVTAGNYVDVPVAAIMDHLLSGVSSWERGDTNTMLDPTIKTTIDLRYKETLWAQLSELVKHVPDLYMRYAGISAITGKHRIELGAFGATAGRVDSDYHLTRPPTVNYRRAKAIKSITPIGGFGAINIMDALGILPGLATDPFFPLVGGKVINATVTKGAEIVKNYDMHKLRDDAVPTLAEKQAAALAVYYSAVHDLKQRSTANIQVSAEAALSYIPVVGNSYRMVYSVKEEWLDQFRMQIITQPVYELDAVMKLVSCVVDYTQYFERMSFIDNAIIEGFVYKLDLNYTGYPAASTDDAVALAQKSERYDRSSGTAPIKTLGVTAVVLNQSGVAPNCILTTGVNGRVFNFAMPAIPGGSTKVYAIIVANNSAIAERIVNPALTPTNAQAEISGANGASWTIASNITATCYYVFF